ncbi:MAG: M48 family metallopeptidase [Gallionella sp.]|nr:M48 family metallopeptidase [Gallionella sp.]
MLNLTFKTSTASVIALLCLACNVHASDVPSDGVSVGKPSIFRNLVPAKQLEQQASLQYADMLQQASSQHALAPDKYPQAIRLRNIAAKIIPYSGKFNPRASQWQWEVNLIGSKQLNAFCMPGGKIVVYSGLIDSLKLTDDEIAIVLAHEIAHALREHARERMAKGELTQLGISLLGQKFGDGRYTGLFQAGGSLLTLKFSRSDETDADIVGLELSSRAGYDPRAGITLWRKMTANNHGAPPQWLSTHPSGQNREKEIQRHLPEVIPLYERAKS